MAKEKEGTILLEEAAKLAAKENSPESWNLLIEAAESTAKKNLTESCDCHMM